MSSCITIQRCKDLFIYLAHNKIIKAVVITTLALSILIAIAGLSTYLIGGAGAFSQFVEILHVADSLGLISLVWVMTGFGVLGVLLYSNKEQQS